MYNRPVFVLTRGEEGVKGSGRSTEKFIPCMKSMCGCAELFTKFGGHPMAQGYPFRRNVENSAEKLNENLSAYGGGSLPGYSH